LKDTIHQIIQLINKFKSEQRPNNRVIEDRLLLILTEFKKDIIKDILKELKDININ
jgi:hypothetical protein